MADAALSHAPQPKGATGVLVLADGHVAWGHGFGAVGQAVGEVGQVGEDKVADCDLVCMVVPSS